MFICAECNHQFDAKSAKCEDWRIEEKSFICPNCDAYLAKANTRKRDTVNMALRIGITSYFAAGFAAANRFGFNWIAILIVTLVGVPFLLLAKKYYVSENLPLVVHALESHNA